MSVPVAEHSCQHLVLLVFFLLVQLILAILQELG